MEAVARGTRIAESVAAAVLLLITLPFVIIAAALSFLCYRTWPFFSHQRVGLDGRHFRLLKVRTLPPATDRYLDKYALRSTNVPNPMSAIRQWHLDELPQLLNVLTGRMGIVGPRPEMQALHDRLPAAFAAERTSVRPGLTCLWQISRHNVGLIGERPEYDVVYVRHRNLRLDLWIIGRTILKVLTGATASLHDVPDWALRGRVRQGLSSLEVVEQNATAVD